MSDDFEVETATVTPADSGWLNTCSCGHETWHHRRPAADRAAHNHRKTHTTTRKDTR